MNIQEAKTKLLAIIKRDAYFREKITLSSGKESDYYIDARLVTLNPQAVELIAAIMLDIVKDDKLDAIGGPTLGADPMIGAIGVLGNQQQKKFTTFIIRKEAKQHGKQRQIEGPPLKEGARVVIIDDVATTGKAFVMSLDVLKEMKVNVVKAICIVDRDEGAKEAIAQKGCPLVSIYKASDIHTPS